MTALVRSVRCDSPMRPGEPCGAARASYAIGCFLAHAVPIGTAATVVLGLAVGPRTWRCWGESKSDIAAATVKRYAYEAYPSWKAQHPDRACPGSWDELNEYVSHKDLRDPWGASYRFFCGEDGIVVASAGDDGRFGTDDDITSE
jgi:hypothetical protein